MTLRFYNSAHVRVRRGLVERGAGGAVLTLAVRWALFEHPRRGLIAIDTGYSAAVTEGRARSLALKLYAAVLRPQLLAQGQIENVLAQLGRPLDLLILSHLHADHLAAARSLGAVSVLSPKPLNSACLREGVFAELLPTMAAVRLFEEGPTVIWRGKTCFDLFEDGSVLAVPLEGHMEGHFGFWFAAEKLLYAVDTQWTRRALSSKVAPRLVPFLLGQERAAAARSRDFVQAFQREGGQVVLCHDPQITPWDAL